MIGTFTAIYNWYMGWNHDNVANMIVTHIYSGIYATHLTMTTGIKLT